MMYTDGKCTERGFPLFNAKMADYIEEQKSELEALQAMYSEEELQILEELKGFVISVKSEEEEEQLSVELEVKYVPTYPDELPLIRLMSQCELDERELKDLETSLQESAEESKGVVMGFTLVTALQMKLNDIVDQIRERQEEEEKRKEAEEKIKEEQRLKGTPVTRESFTAWKEKFDKERIARQQTAAIELDKCKLTGKQMFERDASLAKSDSQLLDDD